MKITVSFVCSLCSRKTSFVYEGKIPSVVKCKACKKRTPVGKGSP